MGISPSKAVTLACNVQGVPASPASIHIAGGYFARFACRVAVVSVNARREKRQGSPEPASRGAHTTRLSSLVALRLEELAQQGWPQDQVPRPVSPDKLLCRKCNPNAELSGSKTKYVTTHKHALAEAPMVRKMRAGARSSESLPQSWKAARQQPEPLDPHLSPVVLQPAAGVHVFHLHFQGVAGQLAQVDSAVVVDAPQADLGPFPSLLRPVGVGYSSNIR